MKFKGTPNILVRQRKVGPLRKVKNFRFDKNGFYETDNPKLCKFLMRHFEVIEDKEIQGEPVRVEVTEPQIELKHCKKCDFTTTNQGDLLAHYRNAHPKAK